MSIKIHKSTRYVGKGIRCTYDEF